MLQNIKPKRKRTKGGTLTKKEISLVKGLIKIGYIMQDIVYIVNQGRPATINAARISEVKKKPGGVSSKDQVSEYIEIQSSYDPKTLLNPYKDADKRLIGAREAMKCAVQNFNNPAIIFKTETFFVLANIAWTYLLHEKMEREKKGSSKSSNGKYSISLNQALDKKDCTIKDAAVKANLKEITKTRNDVEHIRFDYSKKCYGGVFQACCINFEKYITKWFGGHLALAKELSLALQFVSIQKDQFTELEKSNLPEEIRAIYNEIQDSEFKNNKAFQAAIYTEVIGKQEKITATCIIKKMKAKGFPNFTMRSHTMFWQSKWGNASERNKKATNYGELVIKNYWLWYADKWLPLVEEHCREKGDKYK